MSRARVIATAACVTAFAAANAQASQLIARNATNVQLRVNQGQVLVTFRSVGTTKHVLAWGAVNARPPQTSTPLVKFQINYSGLGFTGGDCKPYSGPSLPWLVAACTGPDGAPTGGYGTLIYLDVLDAPAYGPGWRRENSFVPHKASGGFCYGFYIFNPTKGGYTHPPGQTAPRGPGLGTTYRLTAHGLMSRARRQLDGACTRRLREDKP